MQTTVCTLCMQALRYRIYRTWCFYSTSSIYVCIYRNCCISPLAEWRNPRVNNGSDSKYSLLRWLSIRLFNDAFATVASKKKSTLSQIDEGNICKEAVIFCFNVCLDKMWFGLPCCVRGVQQLSGCHSLLTATPFFEPVTTHNPAKKKQPFKKTF
jgi:hypothetical protein